MSKKNASNVVRQTLQIPFMSIGTIDATAAAADVALGVAERDLASAKLLGNVVVWPVPYGINIVKLRFLLTTNNHTADIDIYTGCLDENGDAELMRLVTLDVVCGQQDANDATHHYADTINTSNEAWWEDVVVTAPGTDHQAQLQFDLFGCNVIVVHGYGTFDGDCIVEVSGC